MRPLKLSMTAFGPYAENQVVDFTELKGRSFFLIHGPTGSGKTTVLDAMCFALYGTTSGSLRNGKQMRSDHAQLSTMTEVVFEFAIGSDAYRVKRNPEQERPKKKGTGTTVVNSNATLWKIKQMKNHGAEAKVIASGTLKVTEEVERLLGFKSHQFRQVVMLPQGEFRELLTANSAKRQEILETLFHTELYRSIELALKQSAKTLENDLQKMTERRQWILKEAETGTPEELNQRYHEHKRNLQELSGEIASNEKVLKEAQAELTAGRQTLEKIREKRDAESALSKLESRAADMDIQRHLLAKARQALNIMDVEKSLRARQAEAKTAARVYENKLKQQKIAAAAKKEAETTLAKEKAEEPRREVARREITRLEGLDEKVNALEKARVSMETARRKAETAEKQQIKARQHLTAIREEIENKTAERDRAATVSGQTAALELKYKEAEQLREKRKSLEKLRAELNKTLREYNQAGESYRQAEENMKRAKEELYKLQETWNKGQAAILAGKLAPGEPCPVCGSLEHPSPARSDSHLPSEEDIKAKQQQVNDCEAACEEARTTLKKIDDRKLNITIKIEDLENILGKKAGIDLTTLHSTAQEAKKMWSKAQKAEETLSNLNRQLEKLKEREKNAGEALDKANSILQKATLSLGNARATLRERESAIPVELRDLQVLKKAQRKARAHLEQLLSAYEQAQRNAEEAAATLVKADSEVQWAWDTLQNTKKRAEEEENSFQRRLREADFENEADYSKAKRQPEEIKHMEEILKKYDQELSAARDRLKRAQKAAEGLAEPDMNQLTKRVTAAEQTYNQLLKKETEYRLQIEREDKWLKSLLELDNSLKELENRYAVLGHLSDVANGRNAYGLTFQRFVLGALLDEVTAAATKRLKLMSRGRYHLHRTMDRARKNAAGGLELEVFDTYTGMSRGVTTLSGGETFLASLSLALGLADVVQSYSGGIHLDTIFVDEGFGTLDSESLDFALKTLIDLREGGRLVGIISHVSELKERIDARLEIQQVEKGSVARFHLS